MRVKEAAEALRNRGYDASVENSVVIVATSDPNFTLKEYEKILQELDYHCSYGMRLKGEAAAEHMKRYTKNGKAGKESAAPPEPFQMPSEKTEGQETQLPTVGEISFKSDETGQMSLF